MDKIHKKKDKTRRQEKEPMMDFPVNIHCSIISNRFMVVRYSIGLTPFCSTWCLDSRHAFADSLNNTAKFLHDFKD
jgi:hypothetical protein